MANNFYFRWEKYFAPVFIQWLQRDLEALKNALQFKGLFTVYSEFAISIYSEAFSSIEWYLQKSLFWRIVGTLMIKELISSKESRSWSSALFVFTWTIAWSHTIIDVWRHEPGNTLGTALRSALKMGLTWERNKKVLNRFACKKRYPPWTVELFSCCIIWQQRIHFMRLSLYNP